VTFITAATRIANFGFVLTVGVALLSADTVTLAQPAFGRNRDGCDLGHSCVSRVRLTPAAALLAARVQRAERAKGTAAWPGW
jgi:hypothetical protein